MDTQYTITANGRKYGRFALAGSAAVAALLMGMGKATGDGFDVDAINQDDDIIDIASVWAYSKGTEG